MAQKLSSGHSAWFEEHLRHILEPKYLVKQEEIVKSYQEGRSVTGGEVLDASKFHVATNSDAVAVFAERTGLYPAALSA